MKLDFTPDAIVTNAGRVDQIGMGVASNGWYELLHGTKRQAGREQTPTLREKLNFFNAQEPCRLHIHNPFGIFDRATYGVDMWYDQLNMSRERAMDFDRQANPQEWEYIKRRLDALEFVQTCQDLPYPVVGYIGSPHRFPFLSANETQTSWLTRALDAIWPVIRGCDVIGLDNFMGSRPILDKRYNGPDGCGADLVAALMPTHELLTEVTNYVSDEWLSLVPKVLSEHFLRTAIAKNAPGAKEWTHRLGDIVPATGKPVDHEPLQAAGAKGETIWVLAETRNGWTDEQMLTQMNRCRQDFPDFRIMVYAAHIPNGVFA